MELFNGENKYVEYKQEYSNTILKTIGAYANFHDGYILIGIKDNRHVIGVSDIEEVKLNIENAINDTLVPKPFYEFKEKIVKNKTVLIIKVYKGDYTPYLYKRKAYMRMDTSTVQVDKITYENLILEGRNLGYEDLLSKEQHLLFSFLEMKMKKELNIINLSDDLLRTLGLIQSSGYNNAAALLADDNPIESSRVQLVAYSDESVRTIKDRQVLEHISIMRQFEECMRFYKKHINVSEVIEGAYRKTIEEVPLVAYREAVANMLVHRDYAKVIDARIEVFSDRVEIVSPGGLPNGLSKEEYEEGRISIARNKIISDIFLRMKIIEKLATGIRRIKEYYRDYRVKPEFVVTDNSVVVVLPKVNLKNNSISNIRRPGNSLIDEKEQKVYELIEENPKIKRVQIQAYIGLEKTQTAAIIKKLRIKGLIVKVGNGPATGYQSAYEPNGIVRK